MQALHCEGKKGKNSIFHCRGGGGVPWIVNPPKQQLAVIFVPAITPLRQVDTCKKHTTLVCVCLRAHLTFFN